MKIPDEVVSLIEEEQAKQQGKFIPLGIDYLEKIGDRAELLVHQLNGQVLGFIFFYCNAPDKESSFITLIATAESSRGKGIGFALVSYVLNLARERGFSRCALEVGKSNTAALNLYKKIGFNFQEDRGEKILMNIDLH
jgi:ribosomal protein S18 acetylase RimI-like enzyme